MFPLYFHHTAPTGPFEVLLWRMLLTLVVMAIVLSIRREFAWLHRLRAERVLAGRVFAAAVLLTGNWSLYIWAVTNGHVVESALGYFINPLVTVSVGVLVLKERLRPMQRAAVGFGIVAVVVLTVAYGRPPWIAIFLALTFAGYGYCKKQIDLSAFESLCGETIVMLPLTVVGLSIMAGQGTLTLTGHGAGHTAFILSLGLVTAVPLVCFGLAARRVPLVLLGLMQYLTPVGQMLCGVVVFNETVSASRWFGFAVVWVALVLLVVDAIGVGGSAHRAAERERAEATS